MSVTIRIRNVPDSVHGVLKDRAAHKGQSLSEYLLGEIASLAAQPTMEELVERALRRPKTSLPESTADAVRAERDGP